MELRLHLKYGSTGGDNFGLSPQSARTLDALLCMQIKSCLPFSNSNPQFKTEQHNHIWIADAHRDNGKRFVVRADEKLTAFIELES
jgi:hypothetical protein